jgi:hypothetical protein
MWVPLNHPFNFRIFHYKPSILGYHDFGKPLTKRDHGITGRFSDLQVRLSHLRLQQSKGTAEEAAQTTKLQSLRELGPGRLWDITCGAVVPGVTGDKTW